MAVYVIMRFVRALVSVLGLAPTPAAYRQARGSWSSVFGVPIGCRFMGSPPLLMAAQNGHAEFVAAFLASR